MPITARYADVWHCFGPPEVLGPKSERISAMAEQAGRDPSSILRAASLSLDGDLDEIRSTIDTWTAAGFGYLVCGWPAEGQAKVQAFADSALST